MYLFSNNCKQTNSTVDKVHINNLHTYLQGEQLYMEVCFRQLVNVTCPMYKCTVAYTGQVTFCKVPEKTRPCLSGQVVYVKEDPRRSIDNFLEDFICAFEK